MSYNCHYPILAATQWSALVTRRTRGTSVRRGSLTSRVSSINLTQLSSKPTQCAARRRFTAELWLWDNEMWWDRGGGASVIFALSPTKSNVIEFVSFVTPSKVKFKNIYKMSESDLRGRDVIQTLDGNEGKQSAPSTKRGSWDPDPSLPFITFPVPKHEQHTLELFDMDPTACFLGWYFVPVLRCGSWPEPEPCCACSRSSPGKIYDRESAAFYVEIIRERQWEHLNTEHTRGVSPVRSCHSDMFY